MGTPRPFREGGSNGTSTLCSKERYSTPPPKTEFLKLHQKHTFQSNNKKKKQEKSKWCTLILGKFAADKYYEELYSSPAASVKRSYPPHLGLDVVSCHDVANRSQSWGGHFVVIVPAGKMVQGQQIDHCTWIFRKSSLQSPIYIT